MTPQNQAANTNLICCQKMNDTHLFAIGETDDLEAFITPWSLVHVLSGMCARKLKIEPLTWQVIHFAYEVKDMYKQDGNSLTNSIGDQASATVGYFLPNPVSENKTLITSAIVFGIFVAMGTKVG